MTNSALNVDEFISRPKEAFVQRPGENLSVSADTQPKLKKVVDRLIRSLDDLNPTSFFNAAPGTDAGVLLSVLRIDPLSPPQVKAVLNALARRGRLAELLHVVREPEFRAYLQAKEVGWDYVVTHWETSPGDSLQFLSGFIVGAGKEAAEIVVLVGSIIGALFDEKLAEKATAFWNAMTELIDFIKEQGVASFVEQQFDRMIKQLDDAIYERRFFDAGQMVGQFVAFIVPLLLALPALAKSVGKLATRTVRLLDDLAELSVDILRRMDIELQRIYEGFIGALGPKFALGGIQGELVDGGRWIMLSDGGVPFGKVGRQGFFEKMGKQGGKQPSNMTPDELEEFFREWTHAGALRKFGSRFAETLEELAVQAQVELFRRLKGEWLSPRDYGTRIHEIYRQLATAFFESHKVRVLPERRLADLAEIPADIKKMTVREFMKGKTKGLDKDFLDGKVGDKKPDLVAMSDDQVFVWDLTTKAEPSHQAKTLFYKKVFERATGKKVEVGETYYNYYSPNAKASEAL